MAKSKGIESELKSAVAESHIDVLRQQLVDDLAYLLARSWLQGQNRGNADDPASQGSTSRSNASHDKP